MSTRDFVCGNTIKIFWVNSGITPSAITAKVYTGSETVIDSSAMTSSGDGHYYYLHTVSSLPGYYVAETTATITGKPFISREVYRAVIKDVN